LRTGTAKDKEAVPRIILIVSGLVYEEKPACGQLGVIYGTFAGGYLLVGFEEIALEESK
jgi:hypothetical protein